MNWLLIEKGTRTIIFGLGVAILPAALNYIGGIDWTSFGVSPSAGVFLGLAVMGLRTITNTPVGKSG